MSPSPSVAVLRLRGNQQRAVLPTPVLGACGHLRIDRIRLCVEGIARTHHVHMLVTPQRHRDVQFDFAPRAVVMTEVRVEIKAVSSNLCRIAIHKHLQGFCCGSDTWTKDRGGVPEAVVPSLPKLHTPREPLQYRAPSVCASCSAPPHTEMLLGTTCLRVGLRSSF